MSKPLKAVCRYFADSWEFLGLTCRLSDWPNPHSQSFYISFAKVEVENVEERFALFLYILRITETIVLHILFLPLDEAIASRAEFVIVSGSDGRTGGRAGGRADGNAFGAS